METILEISDLNVYYGNLRVLKNVSVKVEKNKIITIIGSNGAGKSTLLRGICGLLPVRRGKVFFKGIDITNRKTEKMAALGVSLVPEGREIFTDLTVADNLLLGATCQLRKVRRQEIEGRLDAIFKVFPRLKERTKQMGGTLSGGEQQMLAVGRALMSKPSLLLLDEPSMGLAPIVVKEIFSVIKELVEHDTSVLLIEQNVKSALEVAERGYVLQNGEVVMENSSKHLLENEEVRRMYLGEESKQTELI
jgi:branched-chain amino acid transport system ATP-binding protein